MLREFSSRADFGHGRISPTLIAIIVCCSMFLTAGTWLHAQVAYGVNGTVADSSGAVIPGAQIELRAEATGVVSHAVSSPAGDFTIVLANPGAYTITVSAPGFEHWVGNHVMVEVGKFSTVSPALQPGAATESVQVTAQEIAMNTADPGIGTTIEPELVSAAPIEVNGGPRSIDAFVLQTPGTGAPPSAAGTGIEGSALSINGGITAETNYYYNGIPITEPFTANVSESGNAYPAYEMVSEAHVASATFSAQYGMAAGVVTYKMAGGANDYHGGAFLITRNNFFDSVGFFNGPAWGGANKAPTNHQTDDGFTLSGPATIPHLYNGKNRTFFLFSLDWYGQHEAQTTYNTLPTAAELNGDFSNFVDANGNLIKIFDPLTGQQFVCNGNLNEICQDRFSAVSKSLLPLLQPSSPLRTGTGTDNGEQENEAPFLKSTTNYNHNWGFTIDHNLSASQSIHFSLWNQDVNSPSPGNNMFPNSNELSSATVNQTAGRGYLLNYIKTVSPNLVVTAGVNKTDIDYANHVVNQSATFAAITNAVSFPEVNFDGTFPVTSWGNHSNSNATRRYDNAFVNNWLWTKGKHTLNIGGEFRHTLEDSLICRSCGGDFNFSHRQTADPSDPTSNATGNAFASFLLGSVYSADRNWALPADLRNVAISSYIQDDYKFSPRLTINAGLRWDIPIPFTDKQNNITFADFNMPNTGADGLLGALTKLGSCAVGCSEINRAAIHWKDLGPRLGFSYQVNNKTVVQGGFYVAYMGGGAYAFGLARVAQDYTNALAGSYQSPVNPSSTAPGFGNWDSKQINNPQQITFSPTMANGQQVEQMDPKTSGISPYTQSWSFDIQRELPAHMFLMLAYIGNRAIHLPSSLNQPNMLNPSYLALGNVLNDTVAQAETDPAAIAAGINPIPYTNFVNDYGGNPTNISIIQAMLPYPQFGGTDNHFDQSGTSFYRSFQGQIEKRFTHGLSFLSSLTLAQNWSDVDFGVTLQQNNAQNPQNQKAEWSISSLNQKWNDKNMFTYALPIGAGQRFLNHKGLADEILGGWQVAGIMDYSSGNPLGIYEDTNNVVLSTNSNGDAQPRPNIVPGQARKTYSYSRTRDYLVGKIPEQPVQFNTNAYSEAGQFTFGTAARNYIGITSPPNLMEDFDAMKTFHIGERVRAILRVDYFNAFNRTQFGSGRPPVDNDIDDGSSFGLVQGLTQSNISNRQGQATFRVEF